MITAKLREIRLSETERRPALLGPRMMQRVQIDYVSKPPEMLAALSTGITVPFGVAIFRVIVRVPPTVAAPETMI